MMKVGLVVAILAAFAAAACSAETPNSQATEPTITVADGTRTVDNHAPRWSDGQGWRIADEPLLTLGVDAGERYEMFGPYPDPVRRDDGTIVVADRSAMELRAFDGNGRHLWTAGGPGEGPGEFGYLAYVFPRGDGSLIASDSERPRITVFSSDGDFLDTFEPVVEEDPQFYAARIEGSFSDGSLLALAGRRPDPETRNWPGIEPGERGWASAAVVRYAPDGTRPVLIAEVDRYEVSHRLSLSTPFQATAFVRPYRRGFYYLNGRRPYVERYDADGTLELRFRTPREPMPVTSEDRDRWMEKSLANYEEAGQEMSPERRDAMVFPDTMPLWRNFLVDSEGNAWAERVLGLQHIRPLYWGTNLNSDPFFHETDSVWDVFDPDGIWLGAVELLPDRTIEQIGDDWVMMSGEDDAGVFHVWVYGLIKP